MGEIELGSASRGHDAVSDLPARACEDVLDLATTEHLAELLDRSDDYKVLRRLGMETTPLPVDLEGRLALMVDIETTGLDASVDQVIEVAVVPFQYDETGRVIAVHEPLDELRDPGRPIPIEVTSLTGIDDAAVRGRSIDTPAIEALISRSSLVVAHNAGFDRPFLELLVPGFVHMPWACTMSDVPWREEGAMALRLDALSTQAGFFFDGHRAAQDCMAAIELLRRPLPRTGRDAMSELLRSARRDTMRIAAVRAPFECKDVLKRRNYHWRETECLGGSKSWVVEVAADALDDEIRFLRGAVYGTQVSLPVTRVNAYSRYSARA